MKRFGLGGWLGGSASSIASSKSLTALDESQALAEAMASAVHILNDDVERAEAELSKGTSPFHKLGRGTALFLRAALGFEKEVMKEASERLLEAEESATEYRRKATRNPSTAHQSKIYPVGSEYALIFAESQLMLAVIGVLNESLTESLRGFYRLRQAFNTLYEIVEAEKKYMKKHYSESQISLSTNQSSTLSSDCSTPANGSNDLDKEVNEDLATQLDHKLDVNGDGAGPTTTSVGRSGTLEDNIDFQTVTTDPIDVFIHSGTMMCYGLLQLLLSMVPPAFSKLLSIFAFRGDRETGLALLWKATKFTDNVNGGMAALITLMFHNAAVAVCDIHTREAYPREKLQSLLVHMRTLYPQSVLWILGEAGMASSDRDLPRAVSILKPDAGTSPLKQVEALRVFERSLVYMYMHEYQLCSDSFLKCVELNNWSHGLYYYIAACCNVELYRLKRATDPIGADTYKERTNELLQLVTANTGKKKFMARQLPLDIWINRKITKWASRARNRKCDIVDAIGVSPIVELTYFWGGFGRMGQDHIRTAIERLAWSEDSTRDSKWEQEPADERAILYLLKATCLRNLGEVKQADAMLSEHVFCYDNQQIKSCEHADNWPLPVAHYERAVCIWQDAGGQDGGAEHLQLCSDELARVEGWETYELEARVGMKVTTARQTLRQCGIAHP
ncbi:related to Mitochondrial outer membrane protein iml2 [Ramularia collo-cygni]|uniref:Inclusion body clearance protein IML2 n=1 Tax=Ramularia collo-cygni TaxID=112498 RepID=A0A2D3V7N9_9PEZI|nr:related to Mitochondrial outer membrane protein iml2 [Ramularia collo-cygni]CZT22920.1 related to Mitochondrial outer membrane protein iml2 [Ramularia collo-cygni]